VWGAGEGRRVEDAVLNAPDDAARRTLVEHFLERRLESARSDGRRVAMAARALLHRRGRLPVAELARQTGWSRRQLEREFLQKVGVSPKTLSRVVRFQNLLRLSGRNPARPWSDLAAACGYADQAHLVRDFREFSGATPTERSGNADELARHFVAPERLDALLQGAGPDVAFLQDGGRPGS
jgi:transcriptional regulator GlxA family with amidase domain